jgi:hypothetical protein
MHDVGAGLLQGMAQNSYFFLKGGSGRPFLLQLTYKLSDSSNRPKAVAGVALRAAIRRHAHGERMQKAFHSVYDTQCGHNATPLTACIITQKAFQSLNWILMKSWLWKVHY